MGWTRMGCTDGRTRRRLYAPPKFFGEHKNINQSEIHLIHLYQSENNKIHNYPRKTIYNVCTSLNSKYMIKQAKKKKCFHQPYALNQELEEGQISTTGKTVYNWYWLQLRELHRKIRSGIFDCSDMTQSVLKQCKIK